MNDDNINIIFNGMEQRVPADTTIAGLIDLMKEGDRNLIVELNNEYIFYQQYSSIVLSKFDRVEFINPDFGG